MKRKNCKLYFAIVMLVSFVAWTVAVKHVDVKAIGPQNSSVGFALLNSFFHDATGVHMSLYTITDWLGLVPFFVAFSFAVFGLVQLMKRKSILKVDKSILVLGVFYIAVIFVYLFFEEYVINYRPVLIEGYLEASYPSSTTMLVMCVMPTAIMQLNSRIKNTIFRRAVILIIALFIAFMVIARPVSGVHWITDIIGGALISISLVLAYSFCADFFLK